MNTEFSFDELQLDSLSSWPVGLETLTALHPGSDTLPPFTLSHRRPFH